MPAIRHYLILGAIAGLVTALVTPLVIVLARRRGWVVAPDETRVHTRITPDVGGIAMVVGVVAALLVARFWSVFHPVFEGGTELRGLVAGSIAIFVVGFLDDLRDLSPPAKVAGVVATGIILASQGLTMYYFRLPFLDVFVIPADWIPLITVIWLLGMTQAINLIDGLDGLAAGIVAIAAGAFFVYSMKLRHEHVLVMPNSGPLVAIIAVGVCLGFLVHNFHPARIFMGDSGALLLGMLMAVATSVVGGRADPNAQQYAGQAYFFLAPLLIPLVILGVPMIDTLFAIVRRARSGHGVATRDKNHLHHRLLQLGHGQVRTVLILWAWTALLSSLVLIPVFTRRGSPLFVAAFAMVVLGLFTVLRPRWRARRAP